MGVIAEYAERLAGFMIFSALIVIVAPSGSFKKYIQLILSLMLIGLILQPIIGVVNGADISEANYFKLQAALDKEALREEVSLYEDRRLDTVLAEYKTTLNDQVKQTVSSGAGVLVSESDVSVNENYESESFADVEEIYVTVIIDAPENEGGEAKKIALGKADTSPNSEEVKKNSVERVKKCLTDFYNLSDSNIHVKVQGELQ